MKLYRLIFVALIAFYSPGSAAGQNALINILSHNSGIVKKKETGFLEVTINNTDPDSSIGVYKIRAQISFPGTIVNVQDKDHVLPPGWTITSNNGSVVYLSNGTDIIRPFEARTILIAFRGKNTGGPSTISGNLLFSNGKPPGSEPGYLPGDILADNVSTTTVKVIR